MHTVAEWVASIPDEVSPREGLAFIDAALGDAAEATNEIRDKFAGTVPPPPWPQPPELVTAIERMEGGKLMIARAVELGHGDTKAAKDSPRVLPLVDAGRVLYREIARMQQQHRDGVINPANLPQLAARGLGSFLPTGVGGLVALGVVAYLAGWLDD